MLVVIAKAQELESAQLVWADPLGFVEPMADYTMLIVYASLALVFLFFAQC